MIKKADKKRLISNFMSLLSIQGATYILPLLTMPYLFRVLGAEKFGLVSFALSTVMFLNIIVEYGYNLSATREVSTYSKNKSKLIEIYSTVLSAKIVLLFISFLILTVLILSVDKFSNEWLLFYLSFLIVIGNAIFPIWFFQGIEEMKYISYLNIAAKLFFTVNIFIFVKSSNDYLYQPLLSGLGFILVGIYSIYIIDKKYDIKFKWQSIKNISKSLQDGWNIFLIEFMPNMYNNFSIFLLGFFVSMEKVGYYSLATNIVDVFNKLIYIMRNVTYPYLNKNLDKFAKITKIMVGTGILLSIIIFSTSGFLVPLIFGEKAYHSLELIYILALSPLLFSITLSYGSNKLLLHKQDLVFRNITFKASIFGFISSFIFIYYLGLMGASINLILTRTVMSYLTYNKSQGV
jgi:PST family polysaccharide transporter